MFTLQFYCAQEQSEAGGLDKKLLGGSHYPQQGHPKVGDDAHWVTMAGNSSRKELDDEVPTLRS